MRRICVIARQAGSVLGVLGRELPLLPGAALHRALKQRDIRLNGLRVSSNVQVRPGDELAVFTSVQMQEVPVVYEDADCLVVNKPAGLNTDDNASSHASLIAWARTRAQGGTLKKCWMVCQVPGAYARAGGNSALSGAPSGQPDMRPGHTGPESSGAGCPCGGVSPWRGRQGVYRPGFGQASAARFHFDRLAGQGRSRGAGENL